jgi:hypothetical protein
MKTRRRGGQKIRTQQVNREGKQICQHKFDCCAEVFYALGYMNKKDAIYLSHLKPVGLTTTEVVALLQAAYGPSINEMHLPKNCIIDATTICDGTTILQDDEATVVSMQIVSPTENRAHLFIMYTEKDKKLYAFDPQTGVNVPMDDYIVLFAQIPNVSITLSYIDSHSVLEAHTHAITQPIIDRLFPPRTYIEPAEEEDHDLSLS